MIEVFSTNDPVQLSFAEAVLRQANVEFVTLDAETSALFGGALPWVKRRVLVSDGDAEFATYVLAQALSESEKE